MGARIAVLTGATGGIGRAFAERLLEDEGIDELWAVSRTPKKLERLRGDLGGRAVPLAADLSTAEGLRAVERALLAQPERPTVAYLVNNAGAAKMGAWPSSPSTRSSARLPSTARPSPRSAASACRSWGGGAAS